MILKELSSVFTFKKLNTSKLTREIFMQYCNKQTVQKIYIPVLLLFQ